MSQPSQRVCDQSSGKLSESSPTATSELVTLYDELSEIVMLNNFIYDSFQSFASESGNNFSTNSAMGIGITCKWLCQRQLKLKEEFYRIIQLSKLDKNKE